MFETMFYTLLCFVLFVDKTPEVFLVFLFCYLCKGLLASFFFHRKSQVPSVAVDSRVRPFFTEYCCYFRVVDKDWYISFLLHFWKIPHVLLLTFFLPLHQSHKFFCSSCLSLFSSSSLSSSSSLIYAFIYFWTCLL